MKSSNDFIKKYKLKSKATSNIKIYQVLCSIGLDNVGIFLGDGLFSSDIGMVSLHPSKGTRRVSCIKENYIDSYVRSPPQKLRRFFIKRNGYCSYSEYIIQGLTSKKDGYCSGCCLYII